MKPERRAGGPCARRLRVCSRRQARSGIRQNSEGGGRRACSGVRQNSGLTPAEVWRIPLRAHTVGPLSEQTLSLPQLALLVVLAVPFPVAAQQTAPAGQSAADRRAEVATLLAGLKLMNYYPAR